MSHISNLQENLRDAEKIQKLLEIEKLTLKTKHEDLIQENQKHLAECLSLRESTVQMNEKLNKLEVDNERWQMKCSEFQNRIIAFECNTATLEKNIKDLTIAIQKQTEENQNLQSDINAKLCNITNIEQQLTAIKCNLSDTTKANAILHEQLLSVTAENNRLNVLNTEQKEISEKLSVKNKELLARTHTLENSNDNLSARLESDENALDDLRAELHRITETLSVEMDGIQKFKLENEQIKNENANYKVTITQQESNTKSIETRLHTANTEFKEIQNELIKLQDQHANQEFKMNQLVTENKNIHLQSKSLENDLSSIQKRYNDMKCSADEQLTENQQLVKNLQEEIVDLKLENAERFANMSILTTEKSQIEDDLLKAQNKLQRITEECEIKCCDLKTVNATQQQELQNLKFKYDNELQFKSCELDIVSKNIENKDELLEELNKKIINVSMQLKEEVEQKCDLQQTLDAIAKSKFNIELEKTQLEQKYTSLQADRANIENLYKNINTQLETCKMEKAAQIELTNTLQQDIVSTNTQLETYKMEKVAQVELIKTLREEICALVEEKDTITKELLISNATVHKNKNTIAEMNKTNVEMQEVRIIFFKIIFFFNFRFSLD